ncbi:sensor histidine kinase [Wenyingzhuangia sp. IMCC45533]
MWLQHLLTIGYRYNESDISKKQIKLLNVYACTWFALTLLLITTDSLFSDNPIPTVIGHVIMNTVILITLVLNGIGYYKIAASILIFYGSISFTWFSIKLSPGIFAEFYLLFMPCLAISLFKRVVIPVISLIFNFALFSIYFLFFDAYNGYFPLPAMLVLFVSNFLVMNYLKMANQKQEKLLEHEKGIIEKLVKDSKELDKFKNYYFVHFSHEIRTPLTLIIGYANRIKKTKENAEAVNIIQTQAENIKKVVDSITDLEKFKTNQLPIARKKIAIQTVIGEVCLDYYQLAAQKNIEIVTEFPRFDIDVLVDKNLFKKALENILKNAIEFSDKERCVKLKIDLSEQLHLRIKDYGVGISKDNLEDVFHKFYTTKSSNYLDKQAKGLGLSTTKAIVKAHKFTIDIASEINQFTEVTITIPKTCFCLNET